MARDQYWTAQAEWSGETVFIICGGPSVAGMDLGCLTGRRVIAVNSSHAVWPGADFLIFGDTRWWVLHRAALNDFAGRIVTTALGAHGEQLHRMRKVRPADGAAICPDRQALSMQFTTLHGALNLAAHLGVARIVLIGADMARSADGRSHHHKAHPWPVKPGCWDQQMEQLAWTAAPLMARGIAVINTSAASRIGWWPKLSLAAAAALGDS